MGAGVDLTSWNVLLCSLSPFLSIYLSSLCLIWSLSLPASPSNAPPLFVFSSLQSLSLHLHFSFNVFFLSFVSVSSSFWSMSKICAGTSQQVTLLLWPWTHCRVGMTPELPGSDLSLPLFAQLPPYLSTQPCFVSSLHISSSRGQPQGRCGRARLNWEHVLNNK